MQGELHRQYGTKGGPQQAVALLRTFAAQHGEGGDIWRGPGTGVA